MKIDYDYEISEERIRAYLEIPEIDRLRWLEELCVFTNMFRQAPVVERPGATVYTDANGRRDNA